MQLLSLVNLVKVSPYHVQVAFKNKCLVATDIQIDRFNKNSLSGDPIETEIFSIKLDKVSNFSKLR